MSLRYRQTPEFCCWVLSHKGTKPAIYDLATDEITVARAGSASIYEQRCGATLALLLRRLTQGTIRSEALTSLAWNDRTVRPDRVFPQASSALLRPLTPRAGTRCILWRVSYLYGKEPIVHCASFLLMRIISHNYFYDIY